MPTGEKDKTAKISGNLSLFTDHDIYLFKEGNHFTLYDKLGSHLVLKNGENGVNFAVWAPNAKNVSVIGDFNGWNQKSHPLKLRRDQSGIWESFVPGITKGTIYKYHIDSRYNNYRVDKADPFAFYSELSPRTASRVWDLDYEWDDGEWMKNRHKFNALPAPFSIYEVHIGSWKRVHEEGDRFLSYREMARSLTDYVKEMGFTHVELLPIMEHPFYGSWGYQTTGYFAPTSRYGTPQDFMYLVEYLHQNGIGIILDWVPSHFPSDEHGLAYFDGSYLYEHADPKKGFHPEWKSSIFNYSRNEVRAFLISNALFWLEKYHIDGIRVDAVASMLYLDYARKEGEWIPNKYGGKEDLDAIEFIKKLNKAAYTTYHDVQVIAEESTSWPMVSRPTHIGGLGFGMKWNMGWMHDILEYMSKDPLYRKYHHNKLTFSIWYAFSENFTLPLSHDEVVHGKGSLIGKMPGDEWQRFANLRLLFGLLYGHPGKKLLFMGGEFAQWKEWNHDESLEWFVLQYPSHQGMQKWIRNLNHLYRAEPALHELDFSNDGFEWIDFSDYEQSIISFIRKAKDASDFLIFVFNFTSVPRYDYRIGISKEGLYRELLNSDNKEYWGSNFSNDDVVYSEQIPFRERPYSLKLKLPPLGVVILKPMMKNDTQHN
ncbi:MAG: 1,4-alpha-glucan branching protein GlgB [Candidatus Scalindua sp.]|nr:1,4-alpha-glucan branching protein GlgB [Candidatus Scalindua sp.]